MRSLRKIKINIPKSWNELSDTQLFQMSELFHSGRTALAFDLKAWFILRNIRWWQITKMARNLIILREIPLSELKTHYDFIYKQNGRTKFPFGIKNNAGTIHFPPLDDIENLTAEEFSIADDLHLQFRETGDTEYLQMLTAVLYVKTAGLRPEFHKELLPNLSDSFSNIPVKKLLGIEIAYFGCKNTLVKRFPKVYPKSVSTEKQKKQPGMGKVIMEMTRKDLSKLHLINKINVYTFHAQFQQDIIDAKETQRNHAKNR